MHYMEENGTKCELEKLKKATAEFLRLKKVGRGRGGRVILKRGLAKSIIQIRVKKISVVNIHSIRGHSSTQANSTQSFPLNSIHNILPARTMLRPQRTFAHFTVLSGLVQAGSFLGGNAVSETLCVFKRV